MVPLNASPRRRRLVLLAVLAVLVAAGWFWGKGPVPVTPGVVPRAEPGPRAPRPAASAHRAFDVGVAEVAPEPSPSPGGGFEGRVLSFRTGEGIPAAELTFSGAGGASSVSSAASGRWAFSPSAPGTYQLAAVSAPGYLPVAPEWGHSPITLHAHAGARVTGLTVFLTPAEDSLGRVVNPAGVAVAGADVRIIDAGDDAALSSLATHFVTDARGEFRFRAPSGAVLEATHPPFQRGRAQVGRPGETVTLTLLAVDAGVPPTDAIDGRVVDEQGRGLEGALVSVRGRTEEGRGAAHANPSTATDASGHFHVAVDRGMFFIHASLDGYTPASAGADTSAGAPITLTLGRGGHISGRVRTANGRPVASFNVSVSQHLPSGRSRFDTQRAVMDAEGRYDLDGIPAGTYDVRVGAFGHAPSRSKRLVVELPQSGPARADFTLAAGAKLEGFVRDEATHAPLANAKIGTEHALETPSSVLELPSTASDATGHFIEDGLQEGRASVTVEAEGYHSKIVSGLTLAAGSVTGPLSIELTPVKPGEEPGRDLVGIGAVLRPVNEGLLLERTLEGGGAAEAGLVSGDVILELDGQATEGMDFGDAVELIRGPENTRIALTVRHPGKPPMTLQIWRRKIRG